MAKSKGTREGPAPLRQAPTTSGWRALADIVVALIDRIGWPGTVFFFLAWFLVTYATPEQKQEFVNVYFLGHGVRAVYPIVIMGMVGSAIVLRQRYYYRRRVGIMQRRIDQLSKVKSDRQTREIGQDLHHSEVKKRED